MLGRRSPGAAKPRRSLVARNEGRRVIWVRHLAAWLVIALLGACAGPRGGAPPLRDPHRISALASAIEDLGRPVARDEAYRAAHWLVTRAEQLRSDYRMIRPAQLHNLFVHLGLRERGLCCHFAEDLIAGLLDLELRTLDVHWVVARYGSRLREHSSVLLAPSGRDLEQGLVVDGWRRAGELVWARVPADRYPWELHPMSGEWALLHCR